MFDEFVCKIIVSDCVSFSNSIEATAFGFNNGEGNKLITAGHVLTDALGQAFPAGNSGVLYTTFKNHTGILNTNPIPVIFKLHKCNNQSNFSSPSSLFVDLAYIEVQEINPVSKYFNQLPHSNGDTVIGLGYPFGSMSLQILSGTVSNTASHQCLINSLCTANRFLVNHNSVPGCSGGPYIKKINERYGVVGSLIGLIAGSPSHNAIQSVINF